MTPARRTRVLLLTGKGGVGKTTVAAATAVRAASDGARVLVTSTDPAHSLADVLDRPLGDRPVAVAPRLVAQQLDVHSRLEQHWGPVRDVLVQALRSGGVGELRAEELVLLPGLDELFALVDLRHHVAAGEHDLIVVDCAPTAETLRLLALPDALAFWFDRLAGRRGLASLAATPVGRALGGQPGPGHDVLAAVDGLRDDLAAVHGLLTDPTRSTVRLVCAPERPVLDETLRTATALALFGHHVDAVVVNRVLPDTGGDDFLGGWGARHAAHLAAARDAFAPTPVLPVAYADDEPVGTAALQRLADACYGAQDPTEVLHAGRPLQLHDDPDGWTLSVRAPFVERDEVELARRGADLHVRVGTTRRLVPLPVRLRRCEVVGARLRDGTLEVRFRDPAPAAAS